MSIHFYEQSFLRMSLPWPGSEHLSFSPFPDSVYKHWSGVYSFLAQCLFIIHTLLYFSYSRPIWYPSICPIDQVEVGVDPVPEMKEMLFTFMQIHIDIGKVITTNNKEKATKIHPQGPSSALELSVGNKTIQPVMGTVSPPHLSGTALGSPFCWLLCLSFHI